MEPELASMSDIESQQQTAPHSDQHCIAILVNTTAPSLQGMLYDESTGASLRPWLVRTLQPICDADPEALADYVLALLKHDAAEPELRKMFVSQLEEFLEKEAANFVDALFSTLRTKSYLPYESVKSEAGDVGIPIPLDAMMSGPSGRGRKRSLEGDEHERPVPKGPRLSNEGQYPRYPPSNGRMHGPIRGMVNHRGGPMNGRGMGHAEAPMNGHMHGHPGDVDGGNGAPMYRPPGGGFGGRGRRGICRDYYNNGFCARGSLCQYSHGEDAVIPPMPYATGPGMANNIPSGGMPYMPMYGNGVPFGGMPGGAYDPHESHMEMGPRHNRPRVPTVPRDAVVVAGGENQDPSPASSGELPVIQDLTPRDPVLEARGELPIQPNGFTHNFGTPRRGQPTGIGRRGHGPGGFVSGVSGHMGGVGGHIGSMVGHAGDMDGPAGSVAQNEGGMSGHIGGHVGGGGGFKRGGRGTFTGENHTFRNGPRDDKTLVVEKIPEEKLTLEAVNEWFKRFGTVTNVAIDSSSGKALVSFSNHGEAHVAWKSEEAVFGNRFVKLFWHRPLEGQGAVGQRALAASAPLVKNMVTQEPASSEPRPSSQPHAPPPPLPQPSIPSTSVRQKPDPATVAALAARQQLLEKQISEQKVLMSRLSTASTPEEKQEIMARIRTIQGDMKPSTTTTTPPQPSTSKSSNGTVKDQASSEKERLDRELEMHTVQTALQGTPEGVDDEASSTSALKEKLARLKAEASRLGVADAEVDAEPSGPPSSSYRPYRGRGFRARSLYRGGAGRGGTPRSNMKLDNRPRKLLIKGVPANDEGIQTVRNHYQNMGNLETFWTLGEDEVVAQFWNRNAAEQALANGTDIPSIGKVKVSWYTGTTPAPPPVSGLASTPVGHEPTNPPASDVKMEADEPQAEPEDGGWGQAYDEEEERRRRRSRSRSFS